jgi:hypothetical protein
MYYIVSARMQFVSLCPYLPFDGFDGGLGVGLGLGIFAPSFMMPRDVGGAGFFAIVIPIG